MGDTEQQDDYLAPLRIYLQGREQNHEEKLKLKRAAIGEEQQLTTLVAHARSFGEVLAATEAFALAEGILKAELLKERRRHDDELNRLRALLTKVEAAGERDAMKRFLLIAGNNYYPHKGAADWVDIFETREDVEQRANAIQRGDRDWYCIVDLRTWKAPPRDAYGLPLEPEPTVVNIPMPQ